MAGMVTGRGSFLIRDMTEVDGEDDFLVDFFLMALEDEESDTVDLVEGDEVDDDEDDDDGDKKAGDNCRSKEASDGEEEGDTEMHDDDESEETKWVAEISGDPNVGEDEVDTSKEGEVEDEDEYISIGSCWLW